MKSNLLRLNSLLFSLLISAGLIGQISIVSGDMPSPGTNIPTSIDTSLSLTIGNPGGNQTWVFDNLSPDFSEASMIFDPADIPFGNSYPNADFAFFNPSIDGGSFFVFDNSDGQLTELGVVADRIGMAGSPQNLQFSNTYDKYIFPYEFGAFYFDSSAYSVKVADTRLGGDSVWIKQLSAKLISTDAWGKLTTPSGTYNTLRQNNVYEITDSVFTKTTGGPWTVVSGSAFGIEYYEWLGKETFGFPILRIDIDPSQNNRPVRAAFTDLTSPIENNLYQDEITLYPNPVTDKILNFKTDLNISQSVLINIYSPHGQQIFSQKTNDLLSTVSINSVAKGIYFYDLQFEDGRILKSGIIQVQ